MESVPFLFSLVGVNNFGRKLFDRLKFGGPAGTCHKYSVKIMEERLPALAKKRSLFYRQEVI